jgi:hypothetical protein
MSLAKSHSHLTPQNLEWPTFYSTNNMSLEENIFIDQWKASNDGGSINRDLTKI